MVQFLCYIILIPFANGAVLMLCYLLKSFHSGSKKIDSDTDPAAAGAAAGAAAASAAASDATTAKAVVKTEAAAEAAAAPAAAPAAAGSVSESNFLDPE